VIGVRLDTESELAVVAIDAPHKIASSRVYWADTRDDPWKARNAIPVEPAAFGLVLERVIALRGLVEVFRRNHPALAGQQRPLTPSPIADPIRPAPLPSGPGEVVTAFPVLADRCARCRSELRPGWRFCPACGAPSQTARSDV
jgi:hypothetical protein